MNVMNAKGTAAANRMSPPGPEAAVRAFNAAGLLQTTESGRSVSRATDVGTTAEVAYSGKRTFSD
jgi:hypothetical protein